MKLLTALFLFVFSSIAYCQDKPPDDYFQADYMSAQIVWAWSKGTGGPVTGFHIYCRDFSDTDVDYSYFPIMQDVPSATARQYLIGPVIDQLRSFYSKNLIHAVCRVESYNTIGEASDPLVGVPKPAVNVRWQTK